MLALRQGAPAILLVASSCGQSTVGADYRSPAADAKLDAIVQSTRAGGDEDLPRIIEQLDSDDPAVRMSAESALLQLTGERRGYRHYDSKQDRDAAIERWTTDGATDG